MITWNPLSFQFKNKSINPKRQCNYRKRILKLDLIFKKKAWMEIKLKTLKMKKKIQKFKKFRIHLRTRVLLYQEKVKNSKNKKNQKNKKNKVLN